MSSVQKCLAIFYPLFRRPTQYKLKISPPSVLLVYSVDSLDRPGEELYTTMCYRIAAQVPLPCIEAVIRHHALHLSIMHVLGGLVGVVFKQVK